MDDPMSCVRVDLAADAADRHAAHELIAAYFGQRGQLEDREVLRRLARSPWRLAGVECCYRALLARDGDGGRLGAVDAFVAVCRARRLAVCVGSNMHVLPAARGRGVGARIDEALDELLVAAAAAAGLGPAPRLFVVGDVQPIDIDDADTWRRQLLWSRRGYRVIPYAAFPLTHVGLVEQGGGEAVPLPAVVVMRGVGSARRVAHVRRDDLMALADVMAAIASALVDGEHGRDHVEHVRRAIAAYPHDPIALRPLPGELHTGQTLTRMIGDAAFAADGGAPLSARERAWVDAWIARGGPP
ncbi:MAG: hypothetical protein JNL82_09870 [Myxococcales bacterium]|nr:hypothetical protein [Myxococcales bacterium]